LYNSFTQYLHFAFTELAVVRNGQKDGYADYPRRFSDAQVACRSVGYWLTGRRSDLPANSRRSPRDFRVQKEQWTMGFIY